MASFKFNFLSNDTAENLQAGDTISNLPSTKDQNNRVPAARLTINLPNPLYSTILDHVAHATPTVLSVSPSCSIHYLTVQQVRELGGKELAEDFLKLVMLTDTQSSDLVPGLYEGGFKIWECTFDLLKFLESDCVNLTGMKVLDLGCGAGLLGMYALIKGACQVDFHDFNREVLSYLTVPNVLINLSKAKSTSTNDHTHINNCTAFYYGDWSEFGSVLEQERGCKMKYDIVLTSETIYSLESQEKLLKIFERLLSPHGAVFVAAKNHYFGVGGSVLLFSQLAADSGMFDCVIVKEIDAYLPRQIIKLTLK